MSKKLSLIHELDLKLGQYTKVPPRMTFAAQMVRITTLLNRHAPFEALFFFVVGHYWLPFQLCQ